MFKLGLSSKSNAFTKEYFEKLIECGVGIIEVSRCSAGYDGFDFAATAEMAKDAGVMLWSLHLPFKPYDKVDISSPACAKEAVEYNKWIIDEGTKIGIRNFVIHPSGINISPEERGARLETVKASLAALTEYAKGKGARIALENMAHDCLGNSIDEFAFILEAHPDMCVCFDVNHLLHESHTEFVRRFGKKIITTHISDCDFENERHWMPGEGKIDFKALAMALAEVGYEGPWLYEVSYEFPEIEGRYAISDFVENKKALFKSEK